MNTKEVAGNVLGNKERLKELVIKICWEVSFLKEDIQMDRYSKEVNTAKIEKIQDHINELLKEVASE